jgi:hypothetical protein
VVKAGEEVRRCAYPGCASEPWPGDAMAARQGYRGLPDPVAGEPYLALTGFWGR